VVSLVQRHLKYTGSAVARALLADWPTAKAAFVKVFPHEFRHALETKAAAEARAPPCLCRPAKSAPLSFLFDAPLFSPLLC
jgi:hypothetical protein